MQFREQVDNRVEVRNKRCVGCKRHKKDIMMSIFNGEVCLDVFFSNDQIRKLVKELNQVLEENEPTPIVEQYAQPA